MELPPHTQFTVFGFDLSGCEFCLRPDAASTSPELGMVVILVPYPGKLAAWFSSMHNRLLLTLKLPKLVGVETYFWCPARAPIATRQIRMPVAHSQITVVTVIGLDISTFNQSVPTSTQKIFARPSGKEPFLLSSVYIRKWPLVFLKRLGLQMWWPCDQQIRDGAVRSARI